MEHRPDDIVVDGFETEGMTPEEVRELEEPGSKAYGKLLEARLDQESKGRRERIAQTRALIEALDEVA